MMGLDRSELDHLAKVLAALIAAWWRHHARAEAGEDDLVGKGWSDLEGER
jgi:hypothetical protein